MRPVGQALGGEAQIAGRRQRQQVRGQMAAATAAAPVVFRHLDFGLGEVGAALVGLEEVDVPMEAAVAPRVACLLQRLAPLRPQTLEIDRR